MATRKAQTPGTREFQKNLKANQLPGVLMFYGVERFLINWCVELLKNRYVASGMEAMDYAVLDSPTPDEIISACETFSMMSEKRLVWIPDFKPLKTPKGVKGYGEEDMKKLLSYLEHPNEGTICVFSNEEIDGRSKLVKTLKKQGGEYAFPPVSYKELTGFAAKRFRQAGKVINDRNMDVLISATGYQNKESEYHLANFHNDIQKIIACADGTEITAEEIAVCVSGDGDAFLFDLLDGISGNDKSVALEILHNSLKKNAYGGIPIAGAIISQVELMMEIKEFMEDPMMPSSAQALSKYMGIHVFRVEKAMKYASRYSLTKLKTMLLDIYGTYASLLTGELPQKLALELFIARI